MMIIGKNQTNMLYVEIQKYPAPVLSNIHAIPKNTEEAAAKITYFLSLCCLWDFGSKATKILAKIIKAPPAILIAVSGSLYKTDDPINAVTGARVIMIENNDISMP